MMDRKPYWAWLEQLAILNARLVKGVERQMTGCGFTKPEVRLLRSIFHTPESTDRELGRAIGMARSQVSRTVATLLQRDLLSSSPARHRRQRLLNLTDSGKDIAADLDEQFGRAFALELSALSPEERSAIESAARPNISSAFPSQGSNFELRKPALADWGWILNEAAAIGQNEMKWGAGYVADVANIISSNITQAHKDISNLAWVAWIDNSRVAACIVLLGTDPIRSDPGATHAQISLLFVKESSRGLGLGTRLVKECITAAQKMTIESLGAKVSSAQKGPIAILKALKFKPRRQRRSDWRYGTDDEWIDYVLNIAPLPVQ